MSDCRLTTLDNPFNPFTEFDDWYDFDVSHGYCTCGYIARVGYFKVDMPDTMHEDEYERVVDEISSINALGIYKKVTRADYENGKWKPIRLKDEDYGKDRSSSLI